VLMNQEDLAGIPLDPITLPWPPSMNRYWRAVNGRNILSREGRSYRAAVAAATTASLPVLGRLSVQIECYQPDKRRRDLDNLCKGILDGLAHAGVYEDDSQIDMLGLWRVAIDRKNPRVIVHIMDHGNLELEEVIPSWADDEFHPLTKEFE